MCCDFNPWDYLLVLIVTISFDIQSSELVTSLEEPNGIKIAIFNFTSHGLKSKMVGSNGTMIAIRLVRSKLRKREEHSNSVHPTDVVLQTSPATNPAATQQQPLQQTEPLAYRGQFLWQHPPPPPQPCLYNNSQVNTKRI